MADYGGNAQSGKGFDGGAEAEKTFEGNLDGDCLVGLGNLSRIAHTSNANNSGRAHGYSHGYGHRCYPQKNSTSNGLADDDLHHNHNHTTEPGQHQLTDHSSSASLASRHVARSSNGGGPRRREYSQSMDDAHRNLRRPSQTCPSSPSQAQFPSEEAPPMQLLDTSDHSKLQGQQQQRLRQGSLASDWQFPSMHSPAPASPQSLRAQTSPTTRQISRHRADSANPPSPHHHPSASSPRQRRNLAQDLAFQQNTDPLFHHRLISSDPVANTRAPLWSTNGPPTQSKYTSSPVLFNGLPALSTLSQTTRSQQRQIVASPPSRSAPPSYYDHSISFQNELERNESSPYPHASSTVDYKRDIEFEQRSQEAQPQTDTRFDREPLPITPVSPTGAGPRWDSLSPRDRSNLVQPFVTATDAPLSSDRGFPPSPSRTPKSPAFATGPYSHPHIPEDEPLDLQYESDTTRYEQAGPVTTAGHVDRMYRPDSRMSGDTAYSADNYNFSRPRKPSLKSVNSPDFSNNMPLRPGTAKSTASDSLRFESRSMTSSPYNMPHMPYNPSGPRRQPSVGSTMSTATYTSVAPSLRHHASQDHLGFHHGVSHNAAAGNQVGPPHNVRLQAPLHYYNRGGPLAQNQQSHLYEDDIRSGDRSHFTTSTAQETLLMEPERSSVITKTGSVFSSSFRNPHQSAFFGPHNPVIDVRDSLSVDDVMGMYENGFNDSEMDLARRMSGMDLSERASMHLAPSRMNDHDDSRPGSAMSHNSEAANRLLEAMRETGPTPIPGRSFPLNGDSPVILPDTKAFFRKSLARSIPKDMRLSYISTKSRMDDVYGYDDEKEDMAFETDSARHSRHDSGKMVDPRSEENSPIEDPEKQDITLLATDVSIVPNDSLSPRTPVAPIPQPIPSQPIQGALQPEDLDPTANDRYGFRKQNQYVTRQLYDEWNGPYTEYLARRRKKWESFLKENGLMTDTPNRFPQHSVKAKRFVRKGIPPEWRGAAWFYYAGGPKILANNRGVYENMLKRVADGNLKEVCREDIERDLYRTFPDNVRFKRGAAPAAAGQPSSEPTPAHSRNNSTQSANPLPKAPGSEPVVIEQLRRVLSAFAIFNPSIGYCQSLNFLGGMLLLFVESEEQAFWLLNIITRVYLPGTHEMNLEGSKVDLSVLMAELQTTLPSVWTKISDDGDTPVTKKKPRRRLRGGPAAAAAENLPPVTLALTAWFMSCFIGTLPIETTLRVWDVFFYEGSKTLFRVALAIFKAGENEIKAINDPMEVFAVVQTLPRKMLDANLLMETCFKRRSGLNHITSEEIDRSRTERREKLHVEQREKVAAAQAGPGGLQAAATMNVNRMPSDMLSVHSSDGPRRKHMLFGRRAHTGTKERSGIDV